MLNSAPRSRFTVTLELTLLAAFFAAIFPTFAIASLGYFITRKTDLLRHEGMPILTSQIALPALVLHSLLTKGLPLGEMGRLMLITGICVAIGATIVWIACRLMGKPSRFYLTSLVNPNTGNFGTPVVFALLGADALAPALVISVTITLSHFTLGITAMSGSFNWRKLLSNTPLLALLTGALMLGFDLSFPHPIMQLLQMMGGVALPMLLLLLGSSLANLNLKGRRELGTVAALSLYRPLSGFAIAFVVTRFAGLEPLPAMALMLQMSMPVAVMSYLLTLRFKGPSDRIAALTITSLPTSLAVLALIYAFQDLLL